MNAANEITNITGGTITPIYDLAGNMISGPKSGDETTRLHYRYEAWNRLVAVYADDSQNPGQPGDLIARYAYDGTNRRVSKTLADGSSTHCYYNQQWQLLEERQFDAESAPVDSHIYVWSLRYIDAPILRDTYNSAGVLNTSARQYYTDDANYNVTATLNSSGTVTARYAYTPYGAATQYSSTWTNPAAPTAAGPLYCGYWFDAETGNDLARNRYYNVAISSWITRDPIAADANLYRYCGGGPTIATDPLGLQKVGDAKVVSAAYTVKGAYFIAETGTGKLDVTFGDKKTDWGDKAVDYADDFLNKVSKGLGTAVKYFGICAGHANAGTLTVLNFRIGIVVDISYKYTKCKEPGTWWKPGLFGRYWRGSMSGKEIELAVGAMAQNGVDVTDKPARWQLLEAQAATMNQAIQKFDPKTLGPTVKYRVTKQVKDSENLTVTEWDAEPVRE